MCPTGHPAVESIEYHGDEDRDAGVFKLQVDGGDDCIETREQRARGEQVRQPVHAARAGGRVIFVFHSPMIAGGLL